MRCLSTFARYFGVVCLHPGVNMASRSERGTLLDRFNVTDGLIAFMCWLLTKSRDIRMLRDIYVLNTVGFVLND